MVYAMDEKTTKRYGNSIIVRVPSDWGVGKKVRIELLEPKESN